MEEQKDFYMLKQEILEFIFLTMRFEGAGTQVSWNDWMKMHIKQIEQYRLEAGSYYAKDINEVRRLREALISLKIILVQENIRRTQ